MYRSSFGALGSLGSLGSLGFGSDTGTGNLENGTGSILLNTLSNNNSSNISINISAFSPEHGVNGNTDSYDYDYGSDSDGAHQRAKANSLNARGFNSNRYVCMCVYVCIKKTNKIE